jgi:hypothetical protein
MTATTAIAAASAAPAISAGRRHRRGDRSPAGPTSRAGGTRVGPLTWRPKNVPGALASPAIDDSSSASARVAAPGMASPPPCDAARVPATGVAVRARAAPRASPDPRTSGAAAGSGIAAITSAVWTSTAGGYDAPGSRSDELRDATRPLSIGEPRDGSLPTDEASGIGPLGVNGGIRCDDRRTPASGTAASSAAAKSWADA